MPSATRHLARANCLVKLHREYQLFYKLCHACCRAFLRHHNQAASPQPLLTNSSLSELSSSAGGFDSTSSPQSQDAQPNPSSVSFRSWPGNPESSISDFDAMDLNTCNDFELNFDSEQDMDSDGTLEGSDGNNEQSIDDIFNDTAWPLFQSFVWHELEAMYANWYEACHNQHPHGPSLMQFTLETYKTLWPNLFRQDLRVSLDIFNKIIAKILDHPVFFNNSNHPQAPVEDQLAVMLFCFGHYDNAVSLERVKKWAGILKGIVKLATCQVMTAVFFPDFMKDAVWLPMDEEKGRHEALGWRTLMQGLAWWMVSHWWHSYSFLCPALLWYSESYFDCKCNYSFNIQVSCL